MFTPVLKPSLVAAPHLYTSLGMKFYHGMMDVYPSKFDRMKILTHQGIGNLKAHLLALGLGVIAYQKHIVFL